MSERWHLHPSGRPNILGQYTVFRGEGETTKNQVCMANLEDATKIVAVHDLIEGAKLAIESWGDYRPHPNSRASRALKMLEGAIAKALGSSTTGS